MKSKIETSQAAAFTQEDSRLTAIEERLGRLDPQKPKHVAQPYAIGSSVYSISDREGTAPLVVRGYGDHVGRDGGPIILVQGPHDDAPRSWPLVSVQPFEKCGRDNTDHIPSQIQDPAAKAYWEARNEARKPKPEPLPVPRQPKYMRTPD